VTITADNKTMTYGDEEPVLTSTTDGLAGSDYIATVLSREPGNNVGTYEITVQAANNPNYTMTLVNGTLTINPKPVTVTADSKSKIYGTADPELTAAVSGMAGKEKASSLITYTLSRDAGENVGSYTITPAGEARQGNYEVTYVTGTLEILPLDSVIVTIVGNNGEALYDGTAKTVSGYTVTISDARYTENDFTFTGSDTIEKTNAGTYAMGLKKSQFENTNADFTNVIFQVTDGSLTITPRNVTITSGDASKTYDGTALRSDEITFSGDGFAAGEEAYVTTTGRITEVGTAANTFTYTLAAGTLAANYNIETVFGTLTVTEAPVAPEHMLRVTYWLNDGTYVDEFAKAYAEGARYLVATPRMKGYEADIQKVEGTMGTEDLEFRVTYTPIVYTLTVHFTDLAGNELAPSVGQLLMGGESYNVEVPEVEGYTATVTQVTGIMPNANRVVTVLYINNETDEIEGEQVRAITIEDYGTPLGIADSILGGGEIIE